MFWGIYVFEIIVKLIGIGLKEYFIDRYNILDCIVVIFVTTEFILSQTINNSIHPVTFDLIRISRLLKLFKLAKRWR
jgi:hypothetical protein